jgi:branched-chain amino acid transport system ATP-binding protein
VTAALEVRGLTKHFGGLRALDDVTFAVPRGAVLGVIGPNGAGKSTLVNIVTGHLTPSAGRVMINGRDLTGAPPWKLARAGVARTFQVMRPFEDLTVSDNVALGAMYARRLTKRAAGPVARRLLELVGLEASGDQPAGQLAVADSRRLELARALAAGPSVLILDEILGGLARGEIAAGLELLLRLRDGDVTIVIVEHHMGVVQALCDQVLVLERGLMVGAGPPAVVLADPRVIRAYLGGRHPGPAQ